MKTQKTIFNVIALISAFAVVAPAMAMGGVEDQAELLKALNSANTVKAAQQVVDPVVTGITPEVVSVVAKPGYGARLLVLAKNTSTAISEYTKSHGGSATYNTVLKNPTTSAAVALATLAGVGLAYRYRSAVGRAVSYANPFSWFGKKSTSAVAPATESVAPVAKEAPVTQKQYTPKQYDDALTALQTNKTSSNPLLSRADRVKYQAIVDSVNAQQC